MNLSSSSHHLFDTPAAYAIRVQGRLDVAWSARLADMEIHVTELGDGGEETRLVGRLEDQASLAGVLNLLYDMQYTVLSVNRLDEGPAGKSMTSTEMSGPIG